MKTRIRSDMIFSISLIVFVLFTASHSPAGENQSIRLSPKGKIISVVAVDPADHNTLYAGTRSGLFKSSDMGMNWLPMNNGLSNTGILDLVIDPVNTNILYCGTQKGAFKSSDGGRSWSAMNDCIPETGVPAMAIDPSNPDIVYAIARDAAWIMMVFKNDRDESMLKSMTRDCVFMSSNRGQKWSTINNFSDFRSRDLKIDAIAVHPYQPSTLFAGTCYGVYKSTDRGASWPAIDRCLKGHRVKDIVVDPGQEGTLYATTMKGIFRSTDGGCSWKGSNNGLPEGEILALVVDPADSRNLYAGTGAGAFRSTDGGNYWSAINGGLDERPISALVIDPKLSNTLYAGTTEGVFKSTNRGDTWLAMLRN